jgi:hypothetical protein
MIISMNYASATTTTLVYLAQVDAKSVIGSDADVVILDLVKGGVNTVAVQVYPDDDNAGVYWQSSLAPTRKDVLGPFITKAHAKNLKVWAWMNTLDLNWRYAAFPDWRVKVYSNEVLTTTTGWYERISPFVEENNLYIRSLYKEIATKYNVDGFLLQDDLYLSNNEGFDTVTKAAYQTAFGKALTPSILKSDTDSAKFYAWKSNKLTQLTSQITSDVHAIKPNAKVAVNVYPEAVMLQNNNINEDFVNITKAADYSAIMAYQRLEPVHPVSWVGTVTKMAVQKVGSEKIILKIQGYDWDADGKLSNAVINQALSLVKSNGATSYGIYLYDYSMTSLD